MRVVHLPVNIASQISYTVRALRSCAVDSWGLACGAVEVDSDAVELLPANEGANAATRAIRRASRYLRILAAVRRADVVHWHFVWGVPGALDVRFAAMLGKKLVVEFWGSDIRVPDHETRDNPWYAAAAPSYEYRQLESRSASEARQRRFRRAGVRTCLVNESVADCVVPGLFDTVVPTRVRLDLTGLAVSPPDPGRVRPVVVHSPTATAAKGTPAVLAAVEKARATHEVELRLLHQVPRPEVLDALRACDLFLDQFVVGAYGLAAVEAMALGKPVVCYLKPSMVARYPPDLPIVNATQDTLAETLARLLDDGPLRHELGLRGRSYVERHHDARAAARELLALYGRL